MSREPRATPGQACGVCSSVLPTLVSFWWAWSWLRTGKASSECGPSWNSLLFSSSE